jgi:lipopolysaccharide/colanic/teichoic acid biosynthesis glycosyltransferase
MVAPAPADARKGTEVYARLKRLFDIVFAGTLLVLLSPVLLLSAVAVWCSDPGPILFRHQRAGLHGHSFHVLKFRTMIQRHKQTTKSELTFSKDPRITPLGRVLRATKIDELPQLFNVLRGEMSVVGPRPESPRYVAYYTPEQHEVLTVRPGLTGPASVLFRSQEQLLDGMDFEQYYITVLMPVKLGINIDYIRHQSFWLDLKIIVRTIIALVRPGTPPPYVVPSQLAPATSQDAGEPVLTSTTAPASALWQAAWHKDA